MATGFALEMSSEHLQPGHPEHPSRLTLIEKVLSEVDAAAIESRLAALDEMSLVHTRPMLSYLQDQCARGEALIDSAPTYVTHSSFESARRAVGGALNCVNAVLKGDVDNAFAIVRPPGHHAEPGRAMGFCLLNNVAIAAAWSLTRDVQRVAVVDFDAHHGNGTQAAFMNEPRVAYLSLHQWGIYPGTGWIEDAPQARGRIVNVALPARSGDDAFILVADEIIQPFIRNFDPDLILVSAGFDAHWNDPITSLGLSSLGFHRLSRCLLDLANAHCDGRIVFVLEGGYDPVNVANGARAVFAALTGDPFDDPHDSSPHKEPDVESHLARIRGLHRLNSS